MIAFLHTTPLLINRFDKILQQLNFSGEIKHYVNESILQNALLNDEIDANGFQAEIEKIRQERPSLTICTCSTYGAECDKYKEVERIDRPMAEYLVNQYTTIGLAYTATSTKSASRDLLLSSAGKINKTIKIVDCDCTGCWMHLDAGDKETYLKEIAEEISLMESSVEAVFLAQASMENAKNYLNIFPKEVVSSPEYGLQQLLKPFL